VSVTVTINVTASADVPGGAYSATIRSAQYNDAALTVQDDKVTFTVSAGSLSDGLSIGETQLILSLDIEGVVDVEIVEVCGGGSTQSLTTFYNREAGNIGLTIVTDPFGP
jgi:hypothetical protein